MRVDSQPAYVLHTRNYRDTSLLVEFITPDYGRVSGVVKGVRSTGKTAKQRRSLLQPFITLLIAWRGSSDLKTITHFETSAAPQLLSGPRLFSAIYVNELLSRLLQHYDQNPSLYALYEWVLQGLLNEEHIDVVLRRFELRLLEDLGYGIDFMAAVDSHEAIESDEHYLFIADQGFSQQQVLDQSVDKQRLFSGADLLAIREEDFNPSARRAAKRLCRQALQAHLGNKPLKSRELFL